MSHVMTDLRRDRLAVVPAPPHPVLRAARGLPWVQVTLVTAAIVTYFGTRGMTEANPARALRNARDVIAFERWAHLYQEPALQRLVIGHDWVVDVVNWIYIWGHWPVLISVLVYMVRRHPDGYRLLRNALFLSGAIGLVIFMTFPVAPPRLVPGLDLVDTVTQQSHSSRVLQPPGFVNKYAAVPSLHAGWNLLVGLSLFHYARHRVLRVLGVLSPILMSAAVVLTANHYIIDAVLGIIVALIGLALATWWQARSGPSP